MTYPQLINLSMNQTLARSINTSAVAILPVLAVLLIGAQFLGATTLQSYGLALFVGLLSGAYSSIFIASPVLCMMKEREDRWVAIADRLAKRGDTGGWYSAVDAATMSTQMSVAASGQVGRRAVGGPSSVGAVRRHDQAQRGHPTGLGERRRNRGRWTARRATRNRRGPPRRRAVATGSRSPVPRGRDRGRARARASASAEPYRQAGHGDGTFPQAGTLDEWWPWPG